MYRSLRIAAVIPAFNEERAVLATVESVPDFVDHILVIDDASTDQTFREALRCRRPGLEILRHPHNRGVGAAIESGYRRAQELSVDAAAVLAGDGQMDPADLPHLLDPIVEGRVDYAKGNRFTSRSVLAEMPITRLVGNVVLSLATKLTSGYSHLFDSQCGYTAASRRALEVIAEAGLFPRYGYLNDLLARLHSAGLRACDVPVRPVYGPHWRSGIRLRTVIYPMSYVLVRSLFLRWYARLSARALPTPRPAED